MRCNCGIIVGSEYFNLFTILLGNLLAVLGAVELVRGVNGVPTLSPVPRIPAASSPASSATRVPLEPPPHRPAESGARKRTGERVGETLHTLHEALGAAPKVEV